MKHSVKTAEKNLGETHEDKCSNPKDASQGTFLKAVSMLNCVWAESDAYFL